MTTLKLFMAASIFPRTSSCLSACSGSTSYGSLLQESKTTDACHDAHKSEIFTAFMLVRQRLIGDLILVQNTREAVSFCLRLVVNSTLIRVESFR